MTIFLTIFAGVVTFVIGQIILRLYIEPIQSFRSLIGEISAALINCGILYKDSNEMKPGTFNDASIELRALASKLESSVYLIPSYKKMSKFFKLPNEAEVFEASTELVEISHSLDERYNSIRSIIATSNQNKAGNIRSLLKIYVPDSENIIHEPKNM